MVGSGTEREPLRVALLGPVRAWYGPDELALGAPQQRAVLARVAVRANRVVSRGELIDALWGGDPPDTSVNCLHTYIAGLRRVLEPGRRSAGPGKPGRGPARAPCRVLVSAPSGYLLRLQPDRLDAALFARHLAGAREARSAGRAEEAVTAFDRALALWSGTPLPGIPGPFAEAERVRLNEEYWSAVEDRAEIMLASGRDGDVAVELAGQVRDQPLRERLRGLLMLALYRGGRQAEALAAFRDIRRLLVEELGIEPGPELQRLHQQILSADRACAPGPARAAGGGAGEGRRARVTPAQLPHDIGGFTGRDAELARLVEAASRPHPGGAGSPQPGPVVICAIDGAAGVGKTALAVHFGHRVAASFPDGQLFVDLRGFSPGGAPMTPGEALGHLLCGLGADPRAIPADPDDQAGLYRTMLAGRRVLIVLDNAESAEQVRPLLPGSGGCLTVITSRNRPDGLIARDGARRIALDVLPPDEAMALLARCSPAGQVTAEPAAAGELARLCGYLPLALCIAAERAATHAHDTLADVAADLAAEHERLDLLAMAGDTTSVRAAFCWSYRALPAAAARAFRLLSLHPGADITAEATAALLGTTPGSARAVLAELTRRHLLEESARGRYRFHDLIRVYAAELTAGLPRGQQTAAERRVLRWYLHSADAADAVLDPRRPRVPLGPPARPLRPLRFGRYEEALHWCDTERDNLLAVTRHAAESGRHAEAWQLPVALFGYFYLRKPWNTWLAAARIGLAAARKTGDPLGEAATLTSLGIALTDLGQSRQAIGHLTQALPLLRAAGHRDGEAVALVTLGAAHRDLERHAAAIGHLNEALRIWREAGDRWGEAITLQHLGETCLAAGQPGPAISHLRQALEIRDDIGDQYGSAWARHDLGAAHRHLGDAGGAISHLRRALAIRRAIGDRWGEARTLVLLGDTLHSTNRPAEAGDSLAAARVIFTELADPRAAEIGDQPGQVTT